MKPLLTTLIAAVAFSAQAQTYNFSLDGREKEAQALTANDIYTKEKGYGFDFVNILKESTLIDSKFKKEDRGTSATAPFFLSVNVPDGNYKVTVTLGNKKQAGNTVVRAESRRLFVEDLQTKKGEYKTVSFIVNKRNTDIWGTDKNGETKVVDRVKIKDREKSKLNWDDKLTIEVTGEQPACSSIKIEPASKDIPTLFLCGNSTVVDQDCEPWTSWGQIFTNWLDDQAAVANYAESGESAGSFIAQNRLKKILSLAKEGDYIFVEFGHNDQKAKQPGSGAWYDFSRNLKIFIDEARAKKATIVFVTPTQRRNFDNNARIRETHGDYPDAMRAVAKREGVPVIELHDMTRTFFETLGVENSKRSLVHYPAHTYPGQMKAFEDNTHFNPYGAYEISKMVVMGIKDLNLPIVSHIKPSFQPFNPAQPDSFDQFHWVKGPFTDAVKPDGN